MTTTINENTYFARVMDPKPADTRGIPESTDALSEAEFLATANGILEEGFGKGQDMDYVAGRLTELIQANPGIAQKNHLPTDQPTIKTKVQEYYKEQRKTQDTIACLDEKMVQWDAMVCLGGIAALGGGPGPVKFVGFAGVVSGCTKVISNIDKCIRENTQK